MRTSLTILIVLLNIIVAVLTKNLNHDEFMHPKPSIKKFSSLKIDENELKTEYWIKQGKEFIKNQLNRKENTNIAKNVIFFIGDGMSLTTLAATRMYIGGEEKSLSFEKFPYTGLSKTYCLDRIVPDSASTATAFLTGVKANYGTIGVNGQAKRRNCEDALDLNKRVDSIGKWAQNAGKSTGFVTTTRVTHATPAALYANSPERDWENDAVVKKHCKNGEYVIPDIAQQLITGEVGQKLKVILGGGRQQFLPDTVEDEQGFNGLRSDNQNLIEIWEDIAHEAGQTAKYVYNKDELLKVKPKNTDKLLGLFNNDHMLYNLEANNSIMPSLAEMTQKAIEMLSDQNSKGYFLFVEGGRIDTAHHKVHARLALDETAEFSKAIDIARKMTSEEDTLIVVSSDHSHTMSISGYPNRHNDIFEAAASNSDKDNLPYLTLSYANGKGFEKYFNLKTNKRIDPLTVDRKKIRAKFPSTVPIDTETHGGEDVSVFASGPYAHMFTGVIEQNLLPHLMAYACCIGNGEKACN